MASIHLHGRELNSVFQLLGEHENDMTSCLGWCISRSPIFSEFLLSSLGVELKSLETLAVRLQEAQPGSGITDVEIEDPNNLFVIMEAKRGWVLPTHDQLEMYAHRPRFVESGARSKRLVVVSECTNAYSRLFLPAETSNDVEVRNLPWREILHLVSAAESQSRGSERRLLGEVRLYLGRLVTVQPIDSNLVYVVSLSAERPPGWELSFLDITREHRKYMHPVGGKGWPKEPPNYIAFRSGGKLLSIHHIETYKVFRRPHEEVAGIPADVEWEDHFLYSLGPAFGPSEPPSNGPIWPNGRYWCMLDTLFTCSTIAEARDLTRARLDAHDV
jgi:hypothetical protein